MCPKAKLINLHKRHSANKLVHSPVLGHLLELEFVVNRFLADAQKRAYKPALLRSKALALQIKDVSYISFHIFIVEKVGIRTQCKMQVIFSCRARKFNITKCLTLLLVTKPREGSVKKIKNVYMY